MNTPVTRTGTQAQPAMKYDLPLQTPTVVLNITPTDCTSAQNNFKAEFKRYYIDVSTEKRNRFGEILQMAEELNSVPDAVILAKEQAVKDFVWDEIVSFQDIRCYSGGKFIKLLKHTGKAEDEEGTWGDAKNCTRFWFDLFWSSQPYRVALIAGMFSALNNTSDK